MEERMSLSRREFFYGPLAAAGASSLGTGFSRAQEGDELVAAAKREGRGTVYSVVDPTLMQAVVKRFRDKYGIEIELVRLTSSSLGQRLSVEVESGNVAADVVIDTDKLLVQAMTAKGYYAPVEQILGSGAFPASAKTATSIIAGRVPYSMIWNTSEVADAPKSWQALADTKWQKRIMLIDPRLGASPTSWYMLMRKTYGDDFIRTIGRAATISPSAVPGMQQVAAGAQAIYAPAVHQITIGLKAKGAPIEEAFLEPTVSSDNVLSLLAKPPHPNIAKLFAAFCVSVDGQSLLNRDGFSMLPDVPGARPLPQIAEIDPAATKTELPVILSLLGLS
jgi:iron(III) transport system substrate-binding protein